ncbi:DNA polymerase beta superfamily protein [Rubritalea tangerina]|uniref:DNA polymerase beta superfamily protein n=1 Tax=Rubritalea tangerina TaxID=430798 RepID=A0ABW4ZD62_9BACT
MSFVDLSVSGERREEIRVFLEEVEREHGVQVLYACESGSRAWGFASPDSDYDIRFIYQEKEASDFGGEGDTIELPIENDLDAGGWNVDKALGLLQKSNGALIEWLHSPIVYSEVDGFLDEWRGLAHKVLAEWNLVSHYRGHARQILEKKLKEASVTAKSYLYALRTTLCAEWVIRYRTHPPVPFEELLCLLSGEVRVAVDDLLSRKSGLGEKDLIDPIPVIDRFLRKHILSERPDDLSRMKEGGYPEVSSIRRRWTGRAARISDVASLNLRRVKRDDLLLFRSIAGSQAYGTSHSGSDVDYRGVFALPQQLLGGLESLDQVQDERGDDVCYELGKVLAMLQKNNPNMMELMYMPEDCVVHRYAVWDILKPEDFLSKKCELSFANYALGQVKKARGLNKKIVNPEPEERMGLIDFCYVLEGQGAKPLREWADERGIDLESAGLVKASHAPNTYGVYAGQAYRGVFSSKAADELICSSVGKEARPEAWMVANMDAYKKHCKAHKEYWSWVKHRNVDRYQTSQVAGYDAKNMMHTLRLLDVAEEIAREGLIRVRRPNVEFLMRVRSGEMDYNDLLDIAEQKMASVREAYAQCSLPEEPDFAKTNETLMEMRAFIG